MQPPESQLPRPKTQRVVTAAFGMVFIALAILILWVSGLAAGPLLAACIVGGLGLDALLAAIGNRRSLVSRIGPLP